MRTPITVMPSKATDCGKSALTCEVSHVTVALQACLVFLCKRKTMHFLVDKNKVTSYSAWHHANITTLKLPM